jgi:hypothetical protein
MPLGPFATPPRFPHRGVGPALSRSAWEPPFTMRKEGLPLCPTPLSCPLLEGRQVFHMHFPQGLHVHRKRAEHTSRPVVFAAVTN